MSCISYYKSGLEDQFSLPAKALLSQRWFVLEISDDRITGSHHDNVVVRLKRSVPAAMFEREGDPCHGPHFHYSGWIFSILSFIGVAQSPISHWAVLMGRKSK